MHGLGGNDIKTWSWSPKTADVARSSASTQRSSSEERLWLKDFLPMDLPHARIMTFGYDASEDMALSSSHANSLLVSLMDARNGYFVRKVFRGLQRALTKDASDVPTTSHIFSSFYRRNTRKAGRVLPETFVDQRKKMVLTSSGAPVRPQ